MKNQQKDIIIDKETSISSGIAPLESNNRNVYFDNIKGFLIFIVVLAHFCDGTTAKPIHSFISLFHMPAFVFTTGFFARKLFSSKGFKWDKVFFIFLTYLLGQTLSAIFSSQNFSFSPLWGLWYLLATSIWYCICYIIGNINHTSNKGKILILSICLLLCINTPLFINEEIFSLLRISYTIFFFLGYCVEINKKKELTNLIIKNYMYLFFLILITIGLISFSINFNNFSFYDGIINWIKTRNLDFSYSSFSQFTFYFTRYYVVPTLLTTILLFLINENKTIFTTLGKRTLSIYLFHCIFITQERSILNLLTELLPYKLSF